MSGGEEKLLLTLQLWELLLQENDNMNRCVLVTMIVVSVCCLQKCEHYADNEIELR